VSTDGGKTWSKVIPAITIARLAPGLKGLQGGMEPHQTPWDGPNGFVDPGTGIMYSSVGAYITSSEDKGKSFGTVYEGKGTSSAAFGDLVAARTVADIPGYKCPCLVISTSNNKGVTWIEKIVAQADEYNREGTIRYPIPAASPAKKGHYAVAVYQPDHRTVKLYYTRDGAKTWKVATPRPTPENVSIATAQIASVGYTTDGRILVTWRGFKNPGAFNTFVAMLDGDAFGPTIKISPELSIYPPLTYAGNYGLGNGAGDYTTWVQGNDQSAFVAFPLALRGEIEDTYLALVPLSLLAAPKGPALSGDILSTSRGDVVIHPVSHASFVMSWQNKIIYVDPVGGLTLYQELPKPDLILITHIHGDHMDPATLNSLVNPQTPIVAPPSVRKALPETLQARVRTLASGDSTAWEEVGIEAIPSYNITADRAQNHPKTRGDNGYVLTFGDKRVYVMGDTEATPEMLALVNIDIAFMPMNLPFTMTVDQAALAVRALKPKIVYPYHYRGSNLDEFQRLVGTGNGIEVRLGKWY
jgi:L-ascorbate metabolism protein UlaG (beta-lactamase superfamily)